MKSRNMRKKAGALAVVLACSAMLGACGNPLEAVIAKPVFKVGSESCSKDDAKVILMNYQKEYSNLYGARLRTGAESGRLYQRSDTGADGTGLYIGYHRF